MRFRLFTFFFPLNNENFRSGAILPSPMHRPNAAVCRLNTMGQGWNRLNMFHCYFENPSKYSYLILIFKVPLFSLILPCKIYQLQNNSVKLGTEREDASLHLLSPLRTWQEVTSPSVYRNIQKLHTKCYEMQLELQKRKEMVLTLSAPPPWWLPPGTAQMSACRSLHSETKNRMLSSKN